jgi:chromosome segregation ATPase
MIEKTISQIEERLRGLGTLDAARKQELLDLLGKVKAEAGALERTHGHQAKSIADSLSASTEAATSGERSPESVRSSVAGLRSSVEGFEQSHPKLVSLVNSLSNMLANLGF